jgi:RNA polymerase sigma-70 factor, ECF subfamily
MNNSRANSVFIFEGKRSVTERALASDAVMMAREDALETAIRQHARLVYRIAYSALRNHHDAEDATQETFVRVMRYRRKLEGIDDLKTWLARIAWRVAVERSKKRRDASLSDEESRLAIDRLQSSETSAEHRMQEQQTSELLSALIATLPEPMRDALRLSTIEELQPREIAEVLGTSEASVRSRLFRARQMLKEKFAALEGNYGSER